MAPLAPLLQNSADASQIGRPLSLALYSAPPAILACQTFMHWRRRADASFVDVLPAAYVGYVAASAVVTGTQLGAVSTGLAKELFHVAIVGAVVYYFVVFGPGAALKAPSIVGALFIGATGQAILSLVEWRSGWSLWGSSFFQFLDPPRSVATLASPGALGAFLGCAIVFAVAVLAWEGPRSLRLGSWIVLGLGLPGLHGDPHARADPRNPGGGCRSPHPRAARTYRDAGSRCRVRLGHDGVVAPRSPRRTYTKSAWRSRRTSLAERISRTSHCGPRLTSPYLAGAMARSTEPSSRCPATISNASRARSRPRATTVFSRFS